MTRVKGEIRSMLKLETRTENRHADFPAVAIMLVPEITR